MINDIRIVTSYFNPCRYRSRKYNFDVFAERLGKYSSLLTIIEVTTEGNPFELGDAFDTMRVHGDSFMWQKERLLNLAIAKLPESYNKIVWIDCDVIFEDESWLHKASIALDRWSVIQPFETCIRLPRGLLEYRGEGQDGTDYVASFAATFVRDPESAQTGNYADHGHTGFAWASRRDFIDRFGLYDACLTGSGDHLMAHVFAGAQESHCVAKMIGNSHAYARDFGRWASRVNQVTQGQLGYLPGRILHLWHGDLKNRRYRDRNREFQAFAFDPARHIRYAVNGLWEWSEASEDLKQWAHEMLESRKEDGDHIE